MAQTMMLLASLEGDDDLLLLSCMDDDKEPSIYHKIGIDELGEEQFCALFRFKKEDVCFVRRFRYTYQNCLQE